MEPILLKIIDLLKNIHKIESHFEIIRGKPGSVWLHRLHLVTAVTGFLYTMPFCVID